MQLSILVRIVHCLIQARIQLVPYEEQTDIINIFAVSLVYFIKFTNMTGNGECNIQTTSFGASSFG